MTTHLLVFPHALLKVAKEYSKSSGVVRLFKLRANKFFRN